MKKCKKCKSKNANENLACESCGAEFEPGVFDRLIQGILGLMIVFTLIIAVKVIIPSGGNVNVGRVIKSQNKFIKIEYVSQNKEKIDNFYTSLSAPKEKTFIKLIQKNKNSNRYRPYLKVNKMILFNIDFLILCLMLFLLKRNLMKVGRSFPFEDKLPSKSGMIALLLMFFVGNGVINILPIVRLNKDTFFIYSKYGEYNLAKKSIEKLQTADFKNSKNKTVLMVAAESGDINFVKTVLKYGAKTNKIDKQNKNALNYAIKSNNAEVIRFLISKGEKVIRKGNYVSLIDDIDKVSLKTAELLTEVGITSGDVDKDGNNLLHKAVKSSNEEVINYITSKGYDIEEKNKSRETPLWIAVKNQNKEAVLSLIKKDAKLHQANDEGESIFYTVVKNGDMDILKIMLENAKIIDYFNKNMGKNIISLSIKNKNYEVTKILLEQGYKIEKREQKKVLPLLLANEKEKNKIIDLSKILLDNGAITDGKTAYDLIALSKGELIGKLLKLFDKNKEMKVEFFVYCIQKNDSEIISKIGDKFKDVLNVKVDGYAPVHYAYMQKNKEVTEYLINLGTDMKILDENNKTMLMYAVEGNHQTQIEKLLVELDAESSFMEDLNGYTVLSYALRAKNTELAQKILDLRKVSGIKQDTTTDTIFAMYMNENEIAQALMKNDFNLNKEMSYIESPLVKAIKIKNIDAVKLIAKNSKSVDIKDRNDENIIELFLKNFDSETGAEVLKELIVKVSDLNYKDAYGALSTYGEDILTTVVDKVGSIDYKDKSGNTFLITAASEGDLSLVKTLLNKGIKTDVKNSSGKNFVDAALMYNQENVILYLWDYYITNGNIVDNENYFKLFAWICETDNTDELKKVINDKFDYSLKDKSGNTPLMLSVKNNAYKCTELLLKNKEVVNEKNSAGETPLIVSLRQGNLKVSKLLVSAGAEINSVDNEGNSVLLSAMELENQDFVIELMEKGAEITSLNSYGQDILLKSIEKQNIEIINYLMKKNINFDIKDYEGNSAVDYAAKVDNQNLLLEMLDKISYGNFKNNGNDILAYAVKNNNYELTVKLIEKGAKANIKYRSGKVGLIEAIKNNATEITKLLIKSGADVNLRSAYKEVPVIEAYRREQYKVVELMLEKGAEIAAKDGRGLTLFDVVKVSKSFDEKNSVIFEKILSSGYRLNKEELLNVLTYLNSKSLLEFMVKNKIVKLDDSIYYFILKSENLLLVDYLLENKKEYAKILFFYSVQYNNRKLYEHLVEKNPSLLNEKLYGASALHYASTYGNNKLIEFIFANEEYKLGKDPGDDDGWTPLMYAFYNSEYETAILLLEYGADINKKAKNDKIINPDNKNYRKEENYHSALDMLIRAKGVNYYKDYRYYFDEQDINIVDWDGRTTLMKLAKERYNKEEEMLYLLNNGAITSIENNRGMDLKDVVAKLPKDNWARKTFTEWDIDRKNEQLKELFSRGDFAELTDWINSGDNIGYKNRDGKSLLMYAVEMKNSQLIDYLSKKRIDMNYADKYGDTALMYAVADNAYETAEKLLKNGADPNHKNNIGNKAINIAKFRKMRDLLRKNGSK